jgi:hypothetical protein
LQTQPRRAVNLVFQVVFKGLNVPQSFPAMQVQPGLTVTLRGVNGNRVNTADAYGAMYAEQLSEPGRYTISPDTEVAFPCDSLNQIWVMGAAGDGIQATIRGNAVG